MPGGVITNRGALQPGQQPPAAPAPFSNFGDPASFTAAAGKQASDYDTIMANYAGVITGNQNNPITSTNVTPQVSAAPANVTAQNVTNQNVNPTLSGYKQSSDVTSSLSDLSNLATTGGYSEQGKADLRARGVSPTRSIYANAQQNVDRSRALGGGYSPNANATQAQMARDESSQISDINTNVNAGIAQNVASNEIAASGAYGSAAASANAAQQAAGQFDASVTNRAGEFNAANALTASADNAANALNANTGNANRATQNNQFNANNANQIGVGNADRSLMAQFNNRNSTLGAIQGQANLYGTTPALTSTFGNQVMQATNANQNQQNINNQTQRNIFGAAGGY